MDADYGHTFFKPEVLSNKMSHTRPDPQYFVRFGEGSSRFRTIRPESTNLFINIHPVTSGKKNLLKSYKLFHLSGIIYVLCS